MASFVDEVLIRVSSGRGGNGCVAFRREKYVPRGGPAGGDGGRGGDVVFQVRRNMRTLVHLRYGRVFRAKNGQDGEGARRFGAKGHDCVIPLPPGCLLRDAQTHEVLHDFGHAHEGCVTLLSGGRGGWGNYHFRGPVQQAPQRAHSGQPGQERVVHVELRIVADVGFVGLPNAGKSSLLNFFTHARSRVAPYPFTTRIPYLGVLRTGDGRDVILADVPGILERASQGVGLGLRFLKHLTRCAGLAFLIDLADERALHTYDLLCKELYAFSPVFETKARVLVGTKLDLPNARECLQQLRAQHPPTEVCGVSVHNRWGLDELQEAFVRLSDAGAGALRSPVWRNQAPSFMYAQLEDPVCQVRDDFGATVSLSRKRKVRG